MAAFIEIRATGAVGAVYAIRLRAEAQTRPAHSIFL
jgi:hypothetical protein